MKVEILPTAWSCLRQIKLQIRERFGDETAEKAVDQILNSLEMLETFPDIGVMTHDPWLNQAGYRMVIADKRCVSIFRRIDDSIFVYYIADTRTEYAKLFRSFLMD